MLIAGKSYKTMLRWLVAGACAAYIVVFFYRNWEDVAQLSHIKPIWLVWLACLSIAWQFIYAWRFRIVLQKCSEKALPFWPWFKIAILGRFLTTFAPQAGNIYRSVVLKKHYGISYTRYISSFFSFTWMDTCLHLIFALVLVAITQPGLQIGGVSAMVVLVVLAAGISGIPIIIEVCLRKVSFRNKRLSWLHGRLAEMLAVSVRGLADKKYMCTIVLSGIVAFANTIGMCYVCFFSFGHKVDLAPLALLYVVLRLSTHIVITPGNVCVREIAYGVISEQVNIGMAQGVMASMIMRIVDTLILIVFGVTLGGFSLLWRRKYVLDESVEDGDINCQNDRM